MDTATTQMYTDCNTLARHDGRSVLGRIVVAPGMWVIGGRDLEIMGERLADLGALLARDRGQLGGVVGGEIAREADIGGLVDLPAVAGHRAAAQFERGAAQLLGKRTGRTRSEEHTSELQN